MDIDDFKQMYVKELQEARSVEAQLANALPRLHAAAGAATLKQALAKQAEDTSEQAERLDALLRDHGAEPGKHEDQSMSGLLAECEKWVDMLGEPDLRDAGLIASVQRIAHYQIAAYGTLAAWAKQLGHESDLESLLAILEQEKSADESLSEIAKQAINPEAAA